MQENLSSLDLILVNTPQYDYSAVPFQTSLSLAPLGLASIATWLDSQGFVVELIDCEFHKLSPKLVAKAVNEKKPRFVGINLLTPTYHIAMSILNDIDPEIQVVVGGAHANAMPMQVMNDPRMKKVKFLVLGEGEFKLEGLLRGSIQLEDIPGIVYRKNGNIIFNQDNPLDFRWTPNNLDNLPFINRKFLDTDPFYAEGRLEANIVGSRGCAFSCSFCSGSYMMTNLKPRVRSIADIIIEISSLHTEHGVTAIRFVDDLFWGNISNLKKFTTAFINSGLNNNVVWQANTNVNLLWNAPDDVFTELVMSGCRQLSIGIESGSQRILDYVGKGTTPDKVIKLIERLSRHGIRIYGYFMVGYPNETYEEIKATLSFFHECREVSRRKVQRNQRTMFRGNIFEFSPYPQTLEWYRLLSQGFLPEDLINKYYPLVMNGLEGRPKHRWSSGSQFSELSPEEIQLLICEALIQQKNDFEPKEAEISLRSVVEIKEERSGFNAQ